MTLRILVVSNLYPPDVLGGYELVTAEVVERLRARGHEVHVLTTGATRASDPPWVHRELSLVRPFGEVAGLERLRHVLLERRHRSVACSLATRVRPDVVLCASLRRLGLHVPRALAALGVPIVHMINDEWLLAHRPAPGATEWRRLLGQVVEAGPLGARTWRGLTFANAVYPSHALRVALVRAGAPVPEGHVCHHGVDPSLFPERPTRPVSRQPALLFVGRLAPEKGASVAIDALRQARARGLDAQLTIVGEGAERAALKALVDRLGVRAHVSFQGFVPRAELGAVYRAHDVFLFPSRWDEPAGLTYLEAMSSGLAVVAEARGGAAELLVDEDNALVAYGAQAMAVAVLRLVADPGLVGELARGARHTVQRRASLARYVATIERALGEEIARRAEHELGAA